MNHDGPYENILQELTARCLFYLIMTLNWQKKKKSTVANATSLQHFHTIPRHRTKKTKEVIQAVAVLCNDLQGAVRSAAITVT